jgi:hypothetical protein
MPATNLLLVKVIFQHFVCTPQREQFMYVTKISRAVISEEGLLFIQITEQRTAIAVCVETL